MEFKTLVTRIYYVYRGYILAILDYNGAVQFRKSSDLQCIEGEYMRFTHFVRS